MFKPITKLTLTVILSFTFMLIWFTKSEIVNSQNLGGIKTRISRLESENSRLSNRLTRLESQVRGVSSPTPKPSNETLYQPPNVLSQDPMFDRLATLVIELKERIVAIEKHLNLSDKVNIN